MCHLNSLTNEVNLSLSETNTPGIELCEIQDNPGFYSFILEKQLEAQLHCDIFRQSGEYKIDRTYNKLLLQITLY